MKGFYKVASEELLKKLNEIDKKDANNLATCAEYAEGIISYLRNKEESMYVKEGFLKDQPEVNDKVRIGAVEWMVEAQLRFKLENETLFLAVNILDRFLEKEKVTKLKMSLLAATVMLIAAKYEEIYPPHLRDFISAAERPLNRDDMMRTELSILETLKYDLSIPTTLRFLQRYSKLTQCDETVLNLAQYICEIQLLDSKMAKHSPSIMAAAGLYLSQKALKKATSNVELFWKEAKHTEADIQKCAKEMLANMQIKEKIALSNIRRKYGKYKDVTKVVLDQSLAS